MGGEGEDGNGGIGEGQRGGRGGARGGGGGQGRARWGQDGGERAGREIVSPVHASPSSRMRRSETARRTLRTVRSR